MRGVGENLSHQENLGARGSEGPRIVEEVNLKPVLDSPLQVVASVGPALHTKSICQKAPAEVELVGTGSKVISSNYSYVYNGVRVDPHLTQM